MKHTLALLISLPLAALPSLHAAYAPEKRPNILWLSSEDHGPQMGCYGDAYATTPNLDALAARGMIFKHAWSCAPVCAAARTTIISGMFPASMGAEHMRSEVPMPAGKRMFPQYLSESGYFCSNGGKEDYNLVKPGQVWDGKHWRERQPGQPFFAVLNSTTSHESRLRERPHQAIHDPAKVRVPAYHPDTPAVRQDWAQYYDTVTTVDAAAGRHLKELANAGLAEDTIVFYWADHGSGMPRSKRWPCNSGLHVPVIVYFPEKWKALAPKEYAPGAKSGRLISFVDFAPTVLSLAGVKPPAWMQGHAFAGRFQEAPQPFIYGFRGRMDERSDVVRSVTDGRYVYLRNYMPHRSQGQHVSYQFKTPTTQIWWKLFAEGKTTEAQSLFWKTPKAPEELYDLETDPDEVRNLAVAPKHQATLKKMRQAQQDFALRVRDTGFLADAEVHARSGSDAPYEMGHDPKRYDFERVFAAAELASLLKPGAVAELNGYLRDADSGVRYWGAAGLLMRGQTAVDTSKNGLLAALADSSASVRVAAAEALGRYGGADDLQRALTTLKEAADPTRTNVYVAIAAMNSLDALGMKAAPLADAIRALPTKDPKAPERASGYIGSLKSHFLSNASTSREQPQ